MAVRTSLVVLVALAGDARADGIDAAIIGRQDWSLASIDVRTAYLSQTGSGFQSVADGLPGSEQMTIVQPSVLMSIVQSERVTHQISVPVDFITAASPDAVDVTTSASKRNIAGDFDVRSAIKLDDVNTLTTRFVAHAEEWIGGGIVGVGWKRSLADDNATISINGSFGLDIFDDHDHFGTFLGKTKKFTSSINVGASQLLSPTTVLDGSYGVTYQRGTLRTGWNAVPVANGTLEDEIFPTDRLRHAVSVRLSQHLPSTHSTAKLRYRGYVDDFGLRAHAIEASVYQYIVNWLYVRGSYRFYDQNGVDFFTTSLPIGFGESTLRTSDSDLAPLSSHEFSISLNTIKGRGPLKKWSASAELYRYQRSNDLQITALSLGVGRLL